MSNEFEKQVDEKLFDDRIKFFLKKFKFYIFIFFFLVISVPVFYQINVYIKKNKNELAMINYSLALEELNKNNTDIANKLFNNLLTTNNDIIILLSLNQLYQINKSSKNEFIKILDKVIANDILSRENTELLKLQKALLIFDSASEAEMLNLLNINQKNKKFHNISLQIIYDFYLSKNEINKAEKIKLSLNEK